jgi:hypothetical protein
MARKKMEMPTEVVPPGGPEPVQANAPAAPVGDSNGKVTEKPAERPPHGARRRPDVSYKVFSDRTTVLEIAVWETAVEYDGRQGVQHSILLSRSYKNAEGQWVSNHAYRAHDLPLVRFLLDKAHCWCAERRTEDSSAPF